MFLIRCDNHVEYSVLKLIWNLHRDPLWQWFNLSSLKPSGVHECVYQAVFSIRKFYIAQICLLVNMQLHNHVNTHPVKRFKRLKGCLECCKNMRFHCAAGQVALCICTLWWEHCLHMVLKTKIQSRKCVSFHPPIWAIIQSPLIAPQL